MNSGSPPVSWMLVGSVLIIVLTGIASSRRTPKTLRPLSKDGAATEKREISPNRVPARLWEDPIEVGWERIRSIKANNDKKISPGILRQHWEDASKALIERTGNEMSRRIQEAAWWSPESRQSTENLSKNKTNKSFDGWSISEKDKEEIEKCLIAEALTKTVKNKYINAEQPINIFYKEIEKKDIGNKGIDEKLVKQIALALGESPELMNSNNGADDGQSSSNQLAELNRIFSQSLPSEGLGSSNRTTAVLKKALEKREAWISSFTKPLAEFLPAVWIDASGKKQEEQLIIEKRKIVSLNLKKNPNSEKLKNELDQLNRGLLAISREELGIKKKKGDFQEKLTEYLRGSNREV